MTEASTLIKKREQARERMRRYRRRRNIRIAHGDLEAKQQREREVLCNLLSSAKSYIRLHADEADLNELEIAISKKREVLKSKQAS